MGKTGQSKITFFRGVHTYSMVLCGKYTVNGIQFFLIQEGAIGSPHTSSHQLSLMFRDKQLNATHQRKTKSCPKWNLAKKRPNWALFPVLGLSVLPLPLTYCVAECRCISDSNDETTECIMNENDCKVH